MQYCEIKVELERREKVAVHELFMLQDISFQEVDDSTLHAPAAGRVQYLLYVPTEDRAQLDALLALIKDHAPTAAIDVRERDDAEWRDEWKKFFRTRRIGKLAIVPSWEAEAHVPSEGEVTLHLDPGRAFGTGGHESTRLCLQGIDRLRLRCQWRAPLFYRLAEMLGTAHNAGTEPQVLDVGCGSGVLAIAALKQWPHVSGVGIDIDAESIEVAQENAVRNEVTSRLQLSQTPLDKLALRFGVVLANLTGPTLLALCDDLIRRVEPGGVLILSGILEEEAPSVSARYVTGGLVETSRATEGEWAAIEFLRPC